MVDLHIAYKNFESDPEVWKYCTREAYRSLEGFRSILAYRIASYTNADYYQWAVELKSTEEPIGLVCVNSINEPRRCIDIGYVFGKNWWHRGFATEAVRAVISFFFEQIGANRIMAQHIALNTRSGGVMLNVGMQYEGTLRQMGYKDNNLLTYAILSDDYFKTNSGVEQSGSFSGHSKYDKTYR
jgi:ribosomal-protein-alanine N-acetyltransferase